MLRPTPGDPRGAEQHHWNTGAKENQQLNPGGPSKRQKSSGPNQLKQVAQRATIAHLSPMCQHPFISNKPASKVIENLNSFQIREQLFFSGLSTSNVSRLNVPEIKPLVVFKHVLVIKEEASMETSLSHYNSLEYFSNTQGQLIPQKVFESGRN